MSDVIITILFCFSLMICLPVGLLLLRDRLRRPTKQEVSEYSKQFIEKLKNPDIKAIENHFGHALPPALVLLYNDQNEILRNSFDIAESSHASEYEKWHIEYYMPASKDSPCCGWPKLENYFEFANDGYGNGYIIDPKQNDPEVLFYDHETDDIVRVCSRLSEFLRWPRYNS